MSDARLDRLAVGRPAGHAPRHEPAGTARRRFLRATGRLGPDDAADLYARARSLDLPPALVDAARFIADRCPPATAPEVRTALFHLGLVILLDMRLGSTRSPIGGRAGRTHLQRRLAPLLGQDGAEAAVGPIEALLTGAVRGVFGPADGPPVPYVHDDRHAYATRLFALERAVGEGLAERLSTDPGLAPAAIQAAVADVIGRPPAPDGVPRPLSAEQAAAVGRSAQAGLSVVSGGPGTGKTSIVVAVLRVLVRLGVAPQKIAVAAPTGKAAQRMTEAIHQGLTPVSDPTPADLVLGAQLPPAETIHRLLGYSPRTGRFARNVDDPLLADVVVIDEASMVDLGLMAALLEGLSSHTQLVLLGDADQLPSVDPGAVLRDLRAADADGQYSTTLTHSFRMDAADPNGARILDAAQAIRRGQNPDTKVLTRAGQVIHGGFEVLRAEDAAGRQRFLDAWVARHLTCKSYQRAARRIFHHRGGDFRADDVRALQALMTRLECFRILAVTRTEALPTGAEALNAAVHERFVARDGPPATAYAPGEPVMMLRNDYERGLFNGDVGVVVQVAVDQQAAAPMVVFRTAPGRYEAFPQAILQQQITLAHAMTVHKAQGSEFDEVAVFLPEVDVPVLSREVLYTGLTRARRSAVVVGSPTLFSRAVTRPATRHTGLTERLTIHGEP